MRKVKMSKKNIVEYLVGKLVVFILECLFAIGCVLGFFALLGLLEQFVETHVWAWIPLIVMALWSIFKMVAESE